MQERVRVRAGTCLAPLARVMPTFPVVCPRGSRRACRRLDTPTGQWGDTVCTQARLTEIRTGKGRSLQVGHHNRRLPAACLMGMGITCPTDLPTDTTSSTVRMVRTTAHMGPCQAQASGLQVPCRTATATGLFPCLGPASPPLILWLGKGKGKVGRHTILACRRSCLEGKAG